MSVEHIGKEANRWEEQVALGEDAEAQIGYGTTPGEATQAIEHIRQAAKRRGQRALATTANSSLREVGAILRGEWQATPATLVKLTRAVSASEMAEQERIAHERAVLASVREQCHQTSLRQVAVRAGVDAANLAHVLNGQRDLSEGVRAKLGGAMTQSDWEHA